MNITRTEAGKYRIEVNNTVYSVFRFESVYGDKQWMIDNETTGQTGIYQCDTLNIAKVFLRNSDK